MAWRLQALPLGKLVDHTTIRRGSPMSSIGSPGWETPWLGVRKRYRLHH